MTKLTGLMLALSAAVALSGCRATGQRITRIDPGQNGDAVVAALGRPDAVQLSGEYQIYTYLHRHRVRHSLRHTDYTVIMKDNRVVQFGPGRARREGVHSWIISQPLD